MFKMQLEGERRLVIILLKNVENVSEIRSMLMNGTLQCCTIKPSLILDPFQVAVAANKAVINELENKMTTKTIHTEILYNLSMSRNITQSLAKFGIDDAERNILVCMVEKCNEDTVETVMSHIKGERCSLEQLNTYTDVAMIKKTYGINDLELSVSTLLNSVVSRIAARNC